VPNATGSGAANALDGITIRPASTNVLVNAAIPTALLARDTKFLIVTGPAPHVGKDRLEMNRRTCRIVGPPPEPIDDFTIPAIYIGYYKPCLKIPG
jgi:hypothetical protein